MARSSRRVLLCASVAFALLSSACSSHRVLSTEDASGRVDEGEGESPPEQDGSDPEPRTETVGATSDASVSEPSMADARADAEPDMDAAQAGDAATGAVSDAADDAPSSDRDAEPPCEPFVLPADCAAQAEGALPSELRCTGLYSDFAARRVACGVAPYRPAYELWSDAAQKSRYLRLPEGSSIDVSDAEGFVFPVGTQLWKEFQVRVGGVLKPAETRLLQKTNLGWLYTTYVFSEDGQSALQTNQGVVDWGGSGHTVPTRDQCRECHAGRKDLALGFDLLLLGEGASGVTREALLAQGRITGRDAAALALTIPGNEVERAALGYLHVNCGVSCHNPGAEANARDTGLYLRLDADALSSVQTTAPVKSGVNKLPSIHAKLPAGGPYYDIRPGDAAHSLVWARMAVRGSEAQMPRIGSHVVDGAGVEAVRRFIDEMSSGAGYPAPAALEDGAYGPGLDAGLDAAGPNDAGSSDAGTNDAAPQPDAGPSNDAGPVPDASTPACQTATPPPTQNLALQTVVRDASLATLSFAAQAPGSDDWYLVEMRGRILRLHDGVLEATPFLDLSGAIDLGAGFDQTTITYDERGLVGLTFAPDYAESGLFYVAITPSRSNALGLAVNHDMVLEYQRGASAGASPSLRRTLVELPSASSYLGNIHNINTLRFGPDGMLYVGSGDGGGVNCNDAELNAAQNIALPFGKILRLDPRQPAPYAALDNPFAGQGDARVFHYGVRNPFRFTFDRVTQDLFIGDVGQNRYEEINYAPKGSRGLNFGWATYEAFASCGQNRPFRSGASHTTPIFVADRTGTGPFSDYRAIVGGVVYRGAALPALAGTYLFGDYYGKRLGALYQCGGQTSSVSILRKSCDPNFAEACLTAASGSPAFGTLTAIVEDHAGEIYFVANGNSLLKLVAR